MTGQFAFEVFCLGGVVPAVIAAGVAFASLRFMPARLAKRYGVAGGFGISFLVGYVLLPEELRASLQPSRYWHWLPYVALCGVIVGPFSQARGRSFAVRSALYLLTAGVAAWLLVPDWESLIPSRLIYVPLLAGYFFLLTTLLEPLPGRISPKLFGALLLMSAVCSTGAVWASISETYGRLGAVACAAWAGISVALFFIRSQTACRAVIPQYATVIGGTAFVGFVYPPDESIVMTLVAPATALVMWAFAWGPLAKLTGKKAIAAQVLGMLISLGIVTAVLAFRLSGGEEFHQ